MVPDVLEKLKLLRRRSFQWLCGFMVFLLNHVASFDITHTSFRLIGVKVQCADASFGAQRLDEGGNFALEPTSALVLAAIFMVNQSHWAIKLSTRSPNENRGFKES